jgi:hypothetical protein
MAPSPIFRRKTEPGSREAIEDQAEQTESLRIAIQTTDVLIQATATILRDPASLQAVSGKLLQSNRKLNQLDVCPRPIQNPDMAESFFKYGSAVCLTPCHTRCLAELHQTGDSEVPLCVRVGTICRTVDVYAHGSDGALFI